MIEIKTRHQIEMMHDAGKILAECHHEIRNMIKPGVTSMEIDKFVEEFLEKHNATPEQKGYMGYKYATCASVNDEVCHGFPRNEPLNDGDVVKIDMVVNYKGWLADSCWCYAVGNISNEAQKLMKVTKDCLYIGIDKAVVGNRIGDISNAIQTYAESQGMSVVRDYTGHGIGRVIHEGLAVPHYGSPGRGPRLKEGMVITIEPMINLGSYEVDIDANEWTARTVDGSLSAQYEHTIAITSEGPIILTDQGDV